MQTPQPFLPRKLGQEPVSPVAAGLLPDGGLVEMVYQPEHNRTLLCVGQEDRWRFESSLITRGERWVPYAPRNNLIQNRAILLPSEPEEYGSDRQLVADIQAFIHRYVDVTPLFETVASYYVFLTWVYDAFNELPYLRLRGEPGSGKTRFLLTVGSICYRPIFASGASTVSPLFRLLDSLRGTLIIDEGDFRFSDERAEIVKILNNGNARGFAVLRSEGTPQREFNPRAYAVFGPKLVATRGYFEDRALESRCITEEMGQTRLRDDVPINLPPVYDVEALHLRNKLLRFRFRNFHRRQAMESLVDRNIAPRLNQVFVPLLSVVEDEAVRKELRDMARRYDRDFIADRGMDTEAQLLEVIRDLQLREATLSVKEITQLFAERHGEDYDRKITTKWVGNLLRRHLYLKTRKSHGVYVIPESERAKLAALFRRYGVLSEEDDEQPKLPATPVDFGDVGDMPVPTPPAPPNF